MSTQIINFPANRVSLVKRPSQILAFKGKSAIRADLPILQSKECVRFDNILTDEKLAKEMFPPDYFMLVE